MKKLLLCFMVFTIGFMQHQAIQAGFGYLSSCSKICQKEVLSQRKNIQTFTINNFLKNPNFISAVKSVACVAGVSYIVLYTIGSICAYITRFNLNDAHSLIDSIGEFLEKTRKEYYRELTLLINSSNQAEQQNELNSIILETVSPSPFIDYVTKTSSCLDHCKSFLKKIENGIPKLKADYQVLINKISSSSQSDRLAFELQDYESTIKKLEELENKLSELLAPLGSLCKFCWQSGTYKQEIIYTHIKEPKKNIKLDPLDFLPLIMTYEFLLK